MKDFLFKDRDGQTPLPLELAKGLKIRTIQTIGELDEYEELNIAKGLSWLEKQTAAPANYQFWMKLHLRLFGDVWVWAGKRREHELANPDFHASHEIWAQVFQLEEDLKVWIAAPHPSSETVAARFHERIETIHPFVNGNGRCGRILAEYLCRHLEYSAPTWGKKFANDPATRRKTYIAALTEARRRANYSLLIEFMFS